jgi:hypothetical protein
VVLCSVVWCGVMWCGVVRFTGVVWFGVAALDNADMADPWSAVSAGYLVCRVRATCRPDAGVASIQVTGGCTAAQLHGCAAAGEPGGLIELRRTATARPASGGRRCCGKLPSAQIAQSIQSLNH